MNKRILWVDVAKAIGIYFIVLGHVLTTGTLRRWIFAFHVPLFFFLAGVTLKTNSTWMDFVKKKAKGLLIPYISFSFVSMAIYEVMVAFLGMKGEKLKFPRDLLVVLYGNSRPDIMKWNTPLWFLPCLFAVSLIIYLLEKVINKVGGQRLRILIIIAFLAGSILGQEVFDLKLPFQMESGLFMIGFCELGVLVQQYDIRNCKKYMLLVPILVLIGILLSNINGFAEVRIYSYGRYPILFVLTSFLLGGACVCLALFFQHNRLLGVLGRNTLTILLLHKFPVVFFQSICPIVKSMLSDSCEFNGTMVALIISVAVIAMCYIAGLVIENMAPIVLGKSR